MDLGLSAEERQSLVEYVKESVNEEESFHCLAFESLHRLNIVQFELKLFKLKEVVRRDHEYPEDDGSLSKTMDEYSACF